MIVRKFNKEKDYKEVMSWWKKQGWSPLPKDALSDSGFIVEKDGVKLASNWIFPTNCPIYIMEWTVGNPDVDWELRKDALDMIIEASCNWAKLDGAKSIFTMTKHDRFIDKLKDNKFIKTDDGMTHLVRSL